MTNWQKLLKGKVKFAQPLKLHTNYRIGGPAKLFFEPKNITDLKSLVSSLKKNKIPVFMIGAGSNILASDKGVEGAVIHLNSSYFRKISVKDNYIESGSGAFLGSLLVFARDHSLAGVEFLTGIPGTVGGALIMNAGAWGHSIGELVEKVDLLDYNGRRVVLSKDDLSFSYRKSCLEKYIILSAKFKLVKESRELIAQRIKDYQQRKMQVQDFSRPSCGCVFKNPEGNSAGKLIDSCGLKGRKSGGAVVSLKHGNFILNQDGAKAADVLKLMGLIKKEVKKKCNIDLQPEVRIWK
ncbi:MAG: UDP-N-acetylmuramate dehydrogenase [Candidatus Omnitrophica bacterium]|nr:UDP-N-acetylmuramate dehydrogenase [Candidatus Omnitrophota bacterium]